MFCEKIFKIDVFLASKILFLDSLQWRAESVCTTVVTTADLCLQRRECKNWILLAWKTPILKIFSQNILYICVEHYFGTENFIHKNNSSMAHLTIEYHHISHPPTIIKLQMSQRL